MSFQKATSLSSRVDQYEKAYNNIISTISKIPDEKTLHQIQTNLATLKNNGPAIDRELENSTDPDIDNLRSKYHAALSGYEANQSSWASIIAKKQAEFKKIEDEKRAQQARQAEASPLSQEQLQLQQDADELEYIQRESSDILKMQKDINELAHQIDDKITEDHAQVVRIEQTVVEANNNMKDGNSELEKAESDQKKCNIF